VIWRGLLHLGKKKLITLGNEEWINTFARQIDQKIILEFSATKGLPQSQQLVNAQKIFGSIIFIFMNMYLLYTGVSL
jgi:hypothetical protein